MRTVYWEPLAQPPAGAVLQRATPTGGCASGSQYTVRIPELRSDGSFVWRNVVEALPMDGSDVDGSDADPFPFPAAWAAIRILYPFQAAGLQAWNDGRMVEVTELTAPAPDGLGWVDTQESGTYAGRYGLGVLHSMNRDVRPFRRVLSAGAAFRREIFAPGSTL